jgi:hypothetical protein
MRTRQLQKDERRKLEFQRHLEKVRQRLSRGPAAPRAHAMEPSGYEKMSEVLEEFVEPFRSPAETETLEDFHKLIGIACAAWNLSFIAEGRRAEMIDSALTSLARVDDRALIRELVEIMVDRKETLFANNRRFIFNFAVEDTGNGFHLVVASSLESSP